MDEPNVEFPQSTQTVNALKLHKNKPQKTAQDWVRDMRMSAAVNKANVGVETEMVTPDLMLATSKKLLGISKHEQEPDPKDSLAFQRFYGPETLFSEHIQRDGGKLGRNLLWKATNKGNLDFMPVGALEKHISSVFYDSKLAQMMDGSSPLETIDSAYKTTRIGEGGVGSVDSAPEEMRTVQPSYFGYIDPVRSPESFRVGLDVYMTKNVMKGTDGKLYQKFIDAKTGKEVLLDSETAANSVIAAPEMMEAKTKSVFALGGPTGVRIVPRSSIQYYLPRADEAYSTSSNLVTMFSGVKEARLQMGCLHPDMPVLISDSKGMIEIKRAKNVAGGRIPGSSKEGTSGIYDIRTTVAKFPPKKNWFVKVILRSGRALITSADHRWPVLRKGQYQLVEAGKLQPGDIAFRSSFKDVPVRRTFLNGIQVSKAFAKVLGYIARSLAEPDSAKMRVEVPEYEKDFVFDQLARYGFKDGFNTYYMNGRFCIGIRDIKFKEWLRENVGATDATRKVPSIIMSAGVLVTSAFLDGYTADATKVGIDSNDDIWVLEIPNLEMRDALSFLFSRIATDTLYRDSIATGELQLALKLVPMEANYGDMIKDTVKVVKKKLNAPIMVDIDINDNLYATANGVVTHNSKYPLQAVSLENREAPLVRGLDEASGKDIHSLIGKYLGARFAPQDGIVTAVRKDRIDVMYDDGTKGSVGLYVNFPMNAKGYINNTPVVKAGQAFKKGDILASSNYTDDKGTSALGTNLRAAWMSWKGGTYEDAILISESAAKKLTSTTMYKTSVDMDKTVKLGKNNYVTWKPAEFTKEQLDTLDNTGVVKPGTLLHKDDPMILAVQVSEPSPGTLGKRVLSDVSEKWEHDHPGVVTDVVKTKRGIKVYATVTAPVEIGDKLSGCFDDKTEVFTERGFVLFKDLTLDDKIAVLQPDGSATFEAPLAYQVDDYKGCMIEHKTKRSSMLITPNHNVAYVPRYEFENGDTRLVKKTAVEVYNHRIFMRVSACFAGVLAHPEMDTIVLPEYTDIKRAKYAAGSRMLREFKRSDFAAFLGIYLAEGYTAHKKGQHWIRISQYDQVEGGKERCAKIAELLDRMGIEWHYYDHQYFVINNWPLEHYLDSLGNSYGKHIPAEVFTEWSKEDIETLLDWFYMGDGEKTLDPDGYQRCATVSKQLADDLQRLYILTGRYSTVHSTNAKNAKSGKVYKISSAYKEFLGYGQQKGNWKIVDDYDGKIYCVTSSTGIILTRRDGIPVWNGQSYGNKGEVAQIIPDDQMPHTAKGEPIDLIFSPLGIITRCYDEQTEFLTKDGWKFGKDVKDSDELYCYNRETATWHWGKQLRPFWRAYYEGTMYGFKNNATDFLVTKGHRVWCKTEYPGAHYKEEHIENIYGKRYVVPCVGIKQDSAPEATPFELPAILIKKKDTHTSNERRAFDPYDWAEFLGWYLAEGNTTYDESSREYRVNIAQSNTAKPWNVERIASLLDRLGLKWNYGKKNNQFHIADKRLASYLKVFGHAWEKYIPDWLFQQPSAVLERFMEGMMLGDGNCMNVGRFSKAGKAIQVCRLQLTSEKLIDQCQQVLCMLGIASTKSIVSKDKRYADAHTMYKLGITTVKQQTRMLRDGWYTEKYAGMTYCPTVDTGYILTRRNGKIICMGNTNPAQVAEALLGKVAHKTGAPITVPHFMKESIADYVDKMMKQYHVSPEDDMVDPETGRVIKGVTNGYSYIYKLKHLAESKMSARGTSSYDAEEVPGGKGFDSSKRFGTLESSAMAGHQALENLKDAKYIRGQSNADFWRSIRTGDIPTMPGEPLVHKKFFAHLTGAGINVRKTPQGVSIFALTNEDVDELAGTREVKSRDTYETRNYRPIDGGLFGQDIFGMNGDKWGYIKLDEPVPNPVMEEPLARLLNIPEKKFADVAAGKEEVNGIRGSVAMKQALEKMNLQVESEKALQGFKTASASGKDKALKRYVAIERMRRSGVNPADYMLDKIPVLPPQFRPITSYNGLTMVADSNYLYAQLIDARDDMRESKMLPKAYQQQARENLYKRWKELTGLYAPEDVKLQSKHVQGLLKWALGDSPKFSGFQRKVLSSTVDTVGRGVVVPDPRLKLNELGLPLNMAFNIMAPFVERALVQRGYTPLQAMEKVKKQDSQARDLLNEVMKTHPVLMNRAPTLHKLGIMAYNPRLVTGHAIHVNPSTVVPFNMDFDGDTVNVHVPVSDAARKEAYNRMMPERNLISMRKHEILYKPEKEYQQGLYIGTRMKKGDTVRTHYFDTVEEARKAFREGIIDIDDPIEIKYK